MTPPHLAHASRLANYKSASCQELAALSESLPASPLRSALEQLLARSAREE
jgi:hypothetical protein